MYRLALVVPLVIAACSAEPQPLVVTGPAPGADTVVAERVMLSQVAADVMTPVGISVDPDSNQLVLIDAWQGVYRQVDGVFALHLGPDQLVPEGMWSMAPYTDVAALPGGQIAVTVMSDGLLYDPANGVTRQHFCYEPGDQGEWEEQYQITNSLTYEASGDRLYATPQTFEGETALDSFAAQFDAEIGTPLGFDTLDDPRYNFGALVATGPDALVLAHGSVLLDYTPTAGLKSRVDLASFGVDDIQGMALDAATGELLVLDASDHEIVRVTGW